MRRYAIWLPANGGPVIVIKSAPSPVEALEAAIFRDAGRSREPTLQSADRWYLDAWIFDEAAVIDVSTVDSVALFRLDLLRWVRLVESDPVEIDREVERLWPDELR